MNEESLELTIFFSSAPERKETDLDVGVGFSNEKQEHSFTNFHDKILVAFIHWSVCPIDEGHYTRFLKSNNER
jgi:hypothetical protein